MKRQKIALVLLMSMLLAGCKAGGKQAQEDLFEKGINQVSKADYKSAVKTYLLIRLRRSICLVIPKVL